MPHEKEAARKRGKSLTLTVGASEATDLDGDADTLAVGLKIADVEPALQLAGKPIVEAKKEKNGVRIQEIEDSAPEPEKKRKMNLQMELRLQGLYYYLFWVFEWVFCKFFD